MKRTILLLSAFCFLFSDLVSAVPPPLPAFPPLVFNPPKPQRMELPNGLILYLLEDHELPLIRLETMTRAGSQYDPPDKVGLSGIFGPVMTRGGSLKYSPDDVLRTLDLTGATLYFSAAVEDASGSMSCRAADFDKIFAVFADLLTAPQFRRSFIRIEKEKAQEALRRMNDEPEDVARREFRRAVYGKTHPYARTPDPSSIDRIKRKDLLDMHQRYYKPNTTVIAVSGDFKSEEMVQKITAVLGAWPRGEVVYPPVPAVTPTKEKGLFYIQRPADQSQIRIGHTGFARHNPDRFAFEVFNELWGGSATSWLFRIIRTQKGLAYSVGSVFTETADLGMIVTVCQTRGPETPQTITSILDINRQVRSAPFTDEEIRSAKEAIRNRFVENFTSSAQIAREFMALEFRGYPKDYLDTYTDKIGRVSRQDLKRVGEKYLHPDASVMLVVGDLSTFNQPLSILGRPQEIRVPDYRLEAYQP
jgi:zinc protease